MAARAAECDEVGVLVLPRTLGGEQVGEQLDPLRVNGRRGTFGQMPSCLLASLEPLGQRGLESGAALFIGHHLTVLRTIAGDSS